MSGRIASCGLGMIIGFIAALALVAVAAFGVYRHFSPQARRQCRQMIERKWNELKSSGDELINRNAPTGTWENTPEPAAPTPRPTVPEPEI